MGQYVGRVLPVINGTFNVAASEGQAVRFDNAGKYLCPITASRDPWIGVSAITIDSGSVGNVLLRGAGSTVKVKVTNTVGAGMPLCVQPDASFTGSIGGYGTSTALNFTGSLPLFCDGFALAAGVTGDIVDAVLL